MVSKAGVIISHPLREYDFAALASANKTPRNICRLEGADEDFIKLTHQMLSDEVGTGIATDPSTGKPATWLFGRVRPAGWTFVAVVEEPSDDLIRGSEALGF